MAWFADRPEAAQAARTGLRRFDRAAAPLIPPTYLRRQVGGPDWGLLVLHAPESGAYRWSVLAQDGPVTAVSMGLPVGIDTSGGPIGLARRLLAGDEIHATVVPPFTFIAAQGDDRVAIQQDWLGMGRLFTARANGITVYCTRPSLAATVLSGTREPDLEGWLSYTSSGQFGGDSSPIRGVRLMRPGERVTAHRQPAGGWRLTSEIRRCADDIVADGVAAQEHGLQAAVELAAEGMLAAAQGISDLYDGVPDIGLSGGKDSRVIAATFLATGRPVTFNTNEDHANEGVTARHLIDIVRDKRGLDPVHRCFRAGKPADVLAHGLFERTERLQNQYDFQFPSSYIERRALPRELPGERRPTISGVGGEIAVGYWYPADDSTDLDFAVARQIAIKRLAATTPPASMAREALAAERARVGAIVDHGAELGVRGQALGDYVYLVERDRRWFSSAYLHGIVSPFLSPEVVCASFAMTAADKRGWALHHGLLARFLPEWSQVPFVHGANAGRSTATAVWDGDGIRVMSDLLDTTRGPLTGLVRREAVRAALEKCVEGASAGRNAALLRQFTYLAVATHTLQPDAVRKVRPTTYRALTGQPESVPAVARAVARPMRFVRRTRVGRKVWKAVRRRLLR